jgi:hypothetical protein
VQVRTLADQPIQQVSNFLTADFCLSQPQLEQFQILVCYYAEQPIEASDHVATGEIDSYL